MATSFTYFTSIVAREQEDKGEEEDDEEGEDEEEEDDDEEEDEEEEAEEKNLKKMEEQRSQGKVRGFWTLFLVTGVFSCLSYQLISCHFSLCKSKWHQANWR